MNPSARCPKSDDCELVEGHTGGCGSDECDDCDGSGWYYLGGEPQACHCQDPDYGPSQQYVPRTSPAKGGAGQ